MADAAPTSVAEVYQRIRRAYPTLTNEQCVGLVRKVAGIRQGVWDWRPGERVDGPLRPGRPAEADLEAAGPRARHRTLNGAAEGPA